MKTNFNKKKFSLITFSQAIKYLLLITSIIIIFFLIYNEIIFKKKYREFINEFSIKYNYQLTSYEISDLSRVDKSEIIKIINKYLDNSIFLISLKKISNEINNLKWVKGVNLSTNLKNKIKVEILEYVPVGLYLYNNKIFYFSKEGIILDKYNKLDEKFIIFSGKNSVINALKLLEILKNIKDSELNKIEEAYYINNRRWNLKFTNKILVYLSEKDIETSLLNYIKLINQLKRSEILLIKSIDLRNNKKAIINFK